MPTIPDSPAHNDQWRAKVPLLSGSIPSFKNYNLEFKNVIKLKQNFERDYRKERRVGDHSTAKIDSLSESIWFSKCVFDALKNYFVIVATLWPIHAVVRKFKPGYIVFSGPNSSSIRNN